MTSIITNFIRITKVLFPKVNLDTIDKKGKLNKSDYI